MTDRIDPSIYPAITLTPPGSQAAAAPAAPAGAAPGAYGPVSAEDKASFVEAMARAWGKALDRQTDVMAQLSDHLRDPDANDMNLTVALLTAESANLKTLSTSAATATNSVSEALQTLSRKQ